MGEFTPQKKSWSFLLDMASHLIWFALLDPQRYYSGCVQWDWPELGGYRHAKFGDQVRDRDVWGLECGLVCMIGSQLFVASGSCAPNQPNFPLNSDRLRLVTDLFIKDSLTCPTLSTYAWGRGCLWRQAATRSCHMEYFEDRSVGEMLGTGHYCSLWLDPVDPYIL
jgi:hypothetical protein